MPGLLLSLIVFTSGAVVMIFELAGSRVLAPYFGTSLVVWTSLIGVILGSLSLGYYLGGRLADKRPDGKIFSLLLLLAAFFIAMAAVIKIPALLFLQRNILDLRLGGALASLWLFAPASVVLGTISPYAVKLKLKTIDATGRTVGNLYAVSTVGSIVGTFAAGYFLIPFFGTTAIIYGLALIMAAASLVAAWSHRRYLKAGLFMLVAALAALFPQRQYAVSPDVNVIDTDTPYSRVLIYDTHERASGRPVRYLLTDPLGIQGAVYLDGAGGDVFEYIKAVRLAEGYLVDPRRALVIGGGAFTYPRDLAVRYPDARVDVVELDPGITELARKYFGLTDDPRIAIFHEDGRTYLNRTETVYDYIFLDAFTSAMSIPFQLTTVETARALKQRLDPDGVLAVNLISAVEGDGGRFFRALYHTYRTVFPHVYAFPLYSPDRSHDRQNIILLAAKRELPPLTAADPETAEFFARRLERPVPSDMPLLTDNYAPVDHYAVSRR